MRPSRVLPALVAITFTCLLCGCIRDRAYRVNPSLVVVPHEDQGPPDAPKDPHRQSGEPYRPSSLSSLPVGTKCEAVTAGANVRLTPSVDAEDHPLENYSGPCLGFIEFDDAGKQMVPEQTERVTDLIHKATADDPHHQPIIITFIHGWKHNASSGFDAATYAGTGWPRPGDGEDSNIQGLEHVLDYLYTGFYKGHVVIGIYIAWHGDVISHYWPVARTISVYSRESAATSVGKKVADTLTHISEAAHPLESASSPTQPMLVFVGHSFGGLMLQEALNTAFIQRLQERQRAPATDAVPTFADLIVFLNTAAPATEAVPILDYLAQQKLQYREDDPKGPPGNRAGRNRPLLISITTPADTATGLLFPVAFSATDFLHRVTGTAAKGQQAIHCFDPATNTSALSTTAPTVSSFSIQSGAQMGFIQSHELIDLGPLPTPGVLTSCHKTNPSDVDVYEYAVPGHCFQVQPKPAGHCNQTPYWIMTTDSNIIPDHGTIFTQRLLELIAEFLPQPKTGIKTITPPRLSTATERKAAQSQTQ